MGDIFDALEELAEKDKMPRKGIIIQGEEKIETIAKGLAAYCIQNHTSLGEYCKQNEPLTEEKANILVKESMNNIYMILSLLLGCENEEAEGFKRIYELMKKSAEEKEDLGRPQYPEWANPFMSEIWGPTTDEEIEGSWEFHVDSIKYEHDSSDIPFSRAIVRVLYPAEFDREEQKKRTRRDIDIISHVAANKIQKDFIKDGLYTFDISQLSLKFVDENVDHEISLYFKFMEIE